VAKRRQKSSKKAAKNFIPDPVLLLSRNRSKTGLVGSSIAIFLQNLLLFCPGHTVTLLLTISFENKDIEDKIRFTA